MGRLRLCLSWIEEAYLCWHVLKWYFLLSCLEIVLEGCLMTVSHNRREAKVQNASSMPKHMTGIVLSLLRLRHPTFEDVPSAFCCCPFLTGFGWSTWRQLHTVEYWQKFQIVPMCQSTAQELSSSIIVRDSLPLIKCSHGILSAVVLKELFWLGCFMVASHSRSMKIA